MRKKRKVLLVEDDYSVQRMMKEMLEVLGCDVTIATLGEQAVQIARKDSFDYYLVDILMPDIDGLEAVEKMLISGVSQKVVVTSADLSPENLEKARILGIQKFLSKPIQMYDLERLFKELEQERDIDS
ncbi:MAG: response regulator [Candidatus Aureabacteria bacterium]|nr:response regulator [Candidatus Auribacterota bacterium]